MQLDVVLEAELQIPLVLPAHGLPIYLQLPDVQEEQKAACWFHNALAQAYADIKNLLFAIRREVDGFDYIQIPPIAIEAMSRCQTLGALEHVVLELRQSYSKVRERFRELGETMMSPDETPANKIRSKAKLVKAINKLFTTREIDSVSVMTSFAAKLNESTKVAEFTDGFDPSDINWTKLVGFLIEKAESTYWKFQLRPLHATKKCYLEGTTKEEMLAVVERLFNHQVSEEEIMRMSTYFQRVEELKKSMFMATGEKIE